MMENENSSSNFKRKMLRAIQDLNQQGKQQEAKQLYQKYFGESNGKNRSS